MKRIVFLLCFLCLQVITVRADDMTEEYIVTSKVIDGSKGFTLEKQGINPFITTFVFKGESYIVKGVKELDDEIIVYGSVNIKNGETFYDAVMVVFDVEGNYIKKVVVDTGELEEVIDVLLVDNMFVMVMEEHLDNDGVFEFNGTHYVLYDTKFVEIDRHYFEDEVINIEVKDSYLLFQFDYNDEYDMAIISGGETIYKEDIIEMKNDSIFIDRITIDFLNDATLNGEAVWNGISIDYPGNYVLEHKNNTYAFTLVPTISGVENNAIYSEDVAISFLNGNAFLNGDIYIPGEEISKPGNYEFILYGINGYEKTIDFTISADIQGLLNMHEYVEPFEFTFNGEGFLNDIHVNSPVYIEEKGDYSFKVLGDKGYVEQYEFSLSEERETSFVDFVQRYDIVILVATILTGIIILKKK